MKTDLEVEVDLRQLAKVIIFCDKQNLPIIYRSNRNNFGRGRGGGAGISKNVTNTGSQLTWEGGRAGITKNVTNAGSQLTF